MSSKAFWIVVAGLAFSLAAFICSYLFLKNAIGDWREMLIAAPLTAFGCGLGCWGIFMARGQKLKFWRGAWVGALVGLLSHPLTWYGSVLYFYLSGEPNTLNPVEGVWASLLYALFSLIFIGWLTVPVGAIVGGLMAYAQARWSIKPRQA